jgi:hypothetical protein
MTTFPPRILLAALAAAGALPGPALAGAANYTCAFGAITIVADIHRAASFIRPTVDGPVVRLRFEHYFGGGAGFVATGPSERFVVRLVKVRTGDALRNRRATMSATPLRGDSARATVRTEGICTAISGAHRVGRLSHPGAVVRTRPRADAPALKSPALPFLWTDVTAWTTDSAPASGWIRVAVLPADGTTLRGFVRRTDVRFVK